MSKKQDAYWICEDCAEKKKWKLPDGGDGITVITGLCYHCDRKDEVRLIPTCDFIKNGKQPIFD